MITMRIRFPRYQKRYLVLKVKGLKFLETWFGTQKCLPPNLTKLYQLLLHMVTMKGMIPVYLALRLGYTGKLINKAVIKEYVELSLVSKNPQKKS